jgi:ribonuclease HII
MLNTAPDDHALYLEAIASKRVAYVIGADEVGFGSWAGPLCVCAVAVPISWRGPAGLNDSKKVRPAKREELYWVLRERVSGYELALAQASEIDEGGVVAALKRCYVDCVSKVKARFPDSIVVVDGEVRVPGVEHFNFPKADSIVPAAMAASILAKVHRDRLMVELGQQYPGYGFGKHAGYGVPEHQKALAEKGPTPIHRMSYLPLQKLTADEIQDEPGLSIERE